jgi:hypothetical protein
VWQSAVVERIESRGRDREAALREMMLRYLALMSTDEPVHTWPLE